MLFTVYCSFTVDASTSPVNRDLTYQELMMKRERALAEKKAISNQIALLDDIIAAKIEENRIIKAKIEASQYATLSGGVKEESCSQKPSPQRYWSDPNLRQQHEDTFLGREISFPGKKTIQESDDDSSLLEAARNTARLVESSTNFPSTMLTPHDALYLPPFHQHDFTNNNAVQDESIEGILRSAAAELNLSSVSPNHASADEAQATSSSHRSEGQIVKKSDSLSKCSDEDEGRQELDDRKPHADNNDDVV